MANNSGHSHTGTGSYNHNSNNPFAHSQQTQQYAPPSGPPPSAQYQPYQQQQPFSDGHQSQVFDARPQPNQSIAPPRRAETFNEEAFVPAAERSEQREAMENFEMHRRGPEDSTDNAVASLQREFPNLDGSLIAAIYGDSQNVGATREMLQELASQSSK